MTILEWMKEKFDVTQKEKKNIWCVLKNKLRQKNVCQNIIVLLIKYSKVSDMDICWIRIHDKTNEVSV